MFGVLFLRSSLEVGHVENSSGGNVWAVLTANIETGPDEGLNLLASTLHIQPPLDRFSFNGTGLNSTNVTCEGSQPEQHFLVTISGIHA